MKPAILLTALLAFAGLSCRGQEGYVTRSGQIRFNASTPLEDIEAENSRVNAILKPESGAFGVVLLISEFEFPRKLMQEHFNENYLESVKYPKATFSGNILPGDLPEAQGSCECIISGTLAIHGVSRPLKAVASISQNSSGFTLRTTFTIRPEDHGIEIPKLLFTKIAEEVQVAVDLLLLPGD